MALKTYRGGALWLILPMMLLLGACSSKIIKLSDRTEVPMSELVGEMKGVRLVFVGEEHTKQWHHDVQLRIIRALFDAGVPVAIGLEMFKAEDQTLLDDWISGKIRQDSFRDIYYKNWQIPWSNYEDIFLFARQANVPLVGLNVPRKIIHQVVQEGFESLTEEQLKEIPGISCDVDAAYEEFIKNAMQGHHGLKDQSFRKFCEAQMVWDGAMALKAVEYLDANPGKTLIVLAGSGHSWRRGIPAQVKKLADYSFIVVLPEAKNHIDLDMITVEDADYVWVGSFIGSLR